MIAINSGVSDPYLNHAIEEVLLEDTDGCFMLWKNRPCILIGKNQNAYSEVNTDYVRDSAIPVVRRPTGGGTVYNDDGNLNFTFITRREGVEFADFMRFTAPVVEALRALGADAAYRGRNDLVIGDKKFSGNAQSWHSDKVLHHGTLLYNSDLTALSRALNVSHLKLLSKGIGSVSARVTNISEHIQNPPDIYRFKDYLFEFVARSMNAQVRGITGDEMRRAESIAALKYRRDDYNWGSNIKFDMVREKRFDAGQVTAELNIVDNAITGIRFWGDYFSRLDCKGLCRALKGTPYSYEQVMAVLLAQDIDGYFCGINAQQIASVII